MYTTNVGELRARYNTLLEQCQKLQGSVKILQATTDELTVNLEKAEKDRDKYKKAFEELFINNIGDEWEHIPEDQKAKMTIDNKLSFFENEMNTAKIYIRQKMNEQMVNITEENERLKKEVSMLTTQLAARDEQLENAKSVAKASTSSSIKGTSAARVMDSSEMLDDMVSSPQKSAKSKVLAGLFGGGATSEKPAEQRSQEKKEDKPVPKEPANPPQEKQEPPMKATTIVSPKKVETKKADEVEKKPATPKTTGFFKRFSASPAAVQAQYKSIMPKLEEKLEKIKFGKEIVTFIAESGSYLQSDINEYGAGKGLWRAVQSDYSNKVHKAIKALMEDKFLIEGAKLQSMGNGRAPTTYLLGQYGELYYALTSMKDPIKSKLIVQGNEQKSVQHGELIQTVTRILEDNGYETFPEVALPTKTTGEMSIADISANKDNFYNIRIECEMGNYDTKGYIFKFTKALEVSDRLLVAVPTLETKKKIEEAVHEMVRETYKGMDNFVRAGKRWLVFTTSELKANPDLILPTQNRKG